VAVTVAEATELARRAHAGQVDKAGRDYFLHVCAVRDALAGYGQDAQVAGVLHDVLEDTTLTGDDLAQAGVPAHVLRAIGSVTRRPGEPYMEMIRRAAADDLGRVVKLADNADNTREDRMTALDPAQASSLRKRYARARAVLEAAAPGHPGSPVP
jgi:(p)ppGpp synthase/HD superfamily hydrolase